MGKKLDDLTGKRFGKWKVISRLPSKDRNVIWKCVCDCGDEGAIHATSLRTGDSKGCRRCANVARRKS